MIILVGLAVLLYPVVATVVNNQAQQRVAQFYQSQLENVPEQELNEAVERAREYNRENQDGPVLDPWLEQMSEDNLEYQRYFDQLAGMPAMSNVFIPAIDVRLPVYHGTDEKTLQNGLGHLFGSSLPVGGASTHTVITGHTGLSTATLFDDLNKVEVGDFVYLSTFGERMKYEVRDIEVVLPNETESLQVQPDRDLLTLITCTPYGINTHRLLVHAERVPMDPEDAENFDRSGSTIQWWMWLLVLLAVLVVVGLAWWLYRESRAARSMSGPRPDGADNDQPDDRDGGDV
ncbi:class C sortase [Corynebacterium sp.]|uniref:class C sortase n=1 Tax=Corynebacterium sp. TaxID=1720 RepID=UPI0037358808